MTPDQVFSNQSFLAIIFATYCLSVLIFKWLDGDWKGAFEVSVLTTVLFTFFVHSLLFGTIEKLTSTKIVLYAPPIMSLDIGCDLILSDAKEIDFESLVDCGERYAKAELAHEIKLKYQDPNYLPPGERVLRVWNNDPRIKTHMILSDN